MSRIQLLIAFQALTLPNSKHHARSRQVIRETLQICELPAHPPRPEDSLEAYLLNWLGLEFE